MRTLILFVVMVAVLFGVMYGLGSGLPAEHELEVSALVDAPQAEVWQRITDLPSQTRWRHELKSLDVKGAKNNLPCWTEHGSDDLNVCVEKEEVPSLRVMHLQDAGGEFRGNWTVSVFAKTPTQTQVTLTETGVIEPPLWRVIARLRGEDAQVKKYLSELETSFTGKVKTHPVV